MLLKYIMSILCVCLIGACSNTKIHLFQSKSMISEDQFAPFLEKNNASLHIQNAKFISAHVLQPTIIHGEDFKSYKIAMKLQLFLAERNIAATVVPATQFNQSYTDNNIGLILIDEQVADIDADFYQNTTVYSGVDCGDGDTYLNLYPNHEFELEVSNWDEGSQTFSDTKQTGSYSIASNVITLRQQLKVSYYRIAKERQRSILKHVEGPAMACFGFRELVNN
jgi:hypothetical protein